MQTVLRHMPFVLVTGIQMWYVGMWYRLLLGTGSQTWHLDTPLVFCFSNRLQIQHVVELSGHLFRNQITHMALG